MMCSRSSMRPAVALMALLALAGACARAAALRPVVFVHVPKTAGSSLSLVFAGLVDELNCTRDALHAPPPMGAHPMPDGAHGPPPAGARCVWAHTFAGPDQDDREAFSKALAGSFPRPMRVDVLLGHNHFGVCPLMNSSLPGPCTYTTVLRPPLQRILSHYAYLKRKEPALLARECGPACDTIDGFAAALANRAPLRRLWVDNTATRMIAGDGLMHTISRGRVNDVAPAADGAMLRLAQHNLAYHFPLIGFTDDLPSYVAGLRELLGLPPPAGGGVGDRPLPRENSNPSPLDAAALAARTRALLLQAQSADVRLWDFARRLARRRRVGATGWGGAEVL